MTTTTHKIPDVNLPKLEAEFARLARRAEKLGLQAPTLVVVETVSSPADADRVFLDYLVRVEGESPRINGWTLDAMLDHAPGGTIVRRISGEDIPPAYWKAHGACDHCRAPRERVTTYLLHHEDGRYAQVGTSCVADFTGHPSPQDLAWQVVFDHNSAGTYRTNDEAASKVERLMGRIWEDEFRLPRPHMADCDASPTGYFFGQRPCTCSAPKRNSRKG